MTKKLCRWHAFSSWHITHVTNTHPYQHVVRSIMTIMGDHAQEWQHVSQDEHEFDRKKPTSSLKSDWSVRHCDCFLHGRPGSAKKTWWRLSLTKTSAHCQTVHNHSHSGVSGKLTDLSVLVSLQTRFQWDYWSWRQQEFCEFKYSRDTEGHKQQGWTVSESFSIQMNLNPWHR